MTQSKSSVVPSQESTQKKSVKRTERKRVVTIAAGFVCPTGLVLCADTQETRGDIKVRVPKLLIRPTSWNEDTDRKLVMAGSGDGALIDKLLDVSWGAALRAAPSIEAVAAAIETSILAQYARLIGCYHPGSMPYAELIFGIWVKGRGVAMYFADGPVMNPVDRNECIGIGEVLARHIIDRMYAQDIPLELAEVLASYMLSHVKEYVDGCGGESMIAAIDLEGNIRTLDATTEMCIATQARNTDSFIPLLTLRALVPEEEFEKALTSFCASLRDIWKKGFIFRRMVSNLQGLDDTGYRQLYEQIIETPLPGSEPPEGEG